jgi:cytochrome d ubiquinol oxidase subunit II
MTDLQVIWYFLIGFLLTGFAILDGFDLGVGFWHLGAKGDKERRTLLNSVGPTWDGNEVWLLTGGGAIFAAFPPVYASVFSGFYMAMMLVVFTLIARAVSLEFRSKEKSSRWRALWDAVFSVSSSLAGLLFGVALGNILRGIPLDSSGNYLGSFWMLLNPYALMIGILGLVMLAFHGALFIGLKTEGELAGRARKWASGSGWVYLGLFLLASVVTVFTQPHLTENYKSSPVLWIVPVLALGFVLAAIFSHQQNRGGLSFVFSSLSIAGMMGLCGAGLFPNLVPALGAPELSLTAANASSSQLTLKTMLILALIGMPVVIGYTIWVYRSFGGKVDVESESAHY